MITKSFSEAELNRVAWNPSNSRKLTAAGRRIGVAAKPCEWFASMLETLLPARPFKTY